MKKIFLTAMALLAMASAQVFGMYGADSDWIDFLTHGNQLRARMQQLGFTLGNDTIRGTFGLHNKVSKLYGNIVSLSDAFNRYNFDPTISMGIGYTSSAISIGVGYNATIGQTKWSRFNGKAEAKTTEAVAHTPVLVLNAMDNAFRMAIPIQVVHHTDKMEGGNKASVTAVSLDAQFRYYTGLEVLPQIRLYLRYGNYGYEKTISDVKDKNTVAESFGFDFRLYFGATVEEVALQPFVKIQYNTALGKQHSTTRVNAVDILNNLSPWTTTPNLTANLETGAWNLTITPALGINASSDIVTLYLEPSLGFRVDQGGSIEKDAKETFSLAYGAYGEIYLRPIQNVEWYFEADVGNTSSNTKGVVFAASTGITWYLPQL